MNHTIDQDNLGFNFLDLDNGSRDDPDGLGAECFRQVINTFLERWPDAPIAESLSGNGRCHILHNADPKDRAAWSNDKKQTYIAHGAPEWKVEFWDPYGQGRYRIFTDRWLNGDADQAPLPTITHTELREFFQTILAQLWRPEPPKRPVGRPPAADPDIPYPDGTHLAQTEQGAALRVAQRQLEQERPMVMLDDGTCYIARDSGLLVQIRTDQPLGAGSRLFASEIRKANHAATQEFTEDRSEAELPTYRHYQDQFITWADSRPANFPDKVLRHLTILAEDEAEHPQLIWHQQNRAPLTQANLNPQPPKDSLYPLADGRIYSTARSDVLSPEEVYHDLHTDDVARLTRTWVPGAFQPDAGKCQPQGQTYAAWLLQAWADSFKLLVFASTRPRKECGFSIMIGHPDRGKTTMLDIWQTLGLCNKTNQPLRDQSRSGIRPFDYLAAALCKERLVFLDELATPLEENPKPIPSGPLKALTGQTTLTYETKFKDEVTRTRRGNLLGVGNHPLLLDAANPAIRERLLFIPEPKEVEALKPHHGLPPGLRNTAECLDAILDAYLQEASRQSKSKNDSPPFTAASSRESRKIRAQHEAHYAAWQEQQRRKQGRNGKAPTPEKAPGKETRTKTTGTRKQASR